MQGRIEVLAGSMFSGKTEELLRRINRLAYSKFSFTLFKPQVDLRYSKSDVVTHVGIKLLARPVAHASEIIEYWFKNRSSVVAIDEVQFFDKNEKQSILYVARYLASQGVRVILAGLDMDGDGNPFGLMPELMAIADEVVKLKACCSVCGQDASMTLHRAVQASHVELGGADKYEARCLTHWIEGRAQKNK